MLMRTMSSCVPNLTDQGCNGGDLVCLSLESMKRIRGSTAHLSFTILIQPPAFKYVMSSGGLQLESVSAFVCAAPPASPASHVWLFAHFPAQDYPYTSGGGSTGKCQYDRSKAVANITGKLDNAPLVWSGAPPRVQSCGWFQWLPLWECREDYPFLSAIKLGGRTSQ